MGTSLRTQYDMPHSLAAERALLAGALLRAEVFSDAAERLTAADFYIPSHQSLWKAMAALHAAGSPIDAHGVLAYLEGQGELAAIGGSEALVEMLADATGSDANLVAYAEIVRGQSVLRQLIDVARSTTEEVYRSARHQADADALVEAAERDIFAIRDQLTKGRPGWISAKAATQQALEVIERLYEFDGEVTGRDTGFASLNAVTAGLQPTDLIIVAGRPAMGKTTLAMNLAESVCFNDKLPALVFSMEMSAEQLTMRMCASLGRIDFSRIRTGKLQDEDWPRLTSAVNLIANAPLYIDEQPALSPTELRARCKRARRELGEIGIIVVDYLQLMTIPGTTENRATEVAAISRSLKALAKEVEAPVVALSQLNRALEQRADKRPLMADLRESGGLEQDADVILFVYRDEVYNPDSPDKGRAELIIGKQRNGSTGVVPLAFQGRYTRFEELIDSESAAVADRSASG